MSTIFIGGSRHLSRLSPEVKRRLDNVIANGHRVVIGDANGADKAVQKHLRDNHYDKVTVFCTGRTPRNILGRWHTHHVDAPKSAKGFGYYAAKDREMAREADFGLMIWDGKSPGTILNVMRLALAGKIAVLINVPANEVVRIKTLDSWKAFISHCSRELQMDVKDRTSADEWRLVVGSDQSDLLTSPGESRLGANKGGMKAETSPERQNPEAFDETLDALNEALAHGDATMIMDAIGRIARELGMTRVARETGLARESLYRSLDANGNPEFATVLKVLSSMGLRLHAEPDTFGSDHQRV